MDNKQQPNLLDNWIEWLQAFTVFMSKNQSVPTSEAPDNIPSAEEFFLSSGLYAQGKLKLDISKLIESYALLREQRAVEVEVNHRRKVVEIYEKALKQNRKSIEELIDEN